MRRHVPAPSPEPQAALPRPKNLPELVAAHERLLIIHTLTHFDGSRTKSAISLGVARKYLDRRMRLLKIDRVAIPGSPGGRPKKVNIGISEEPKKKAI